MVELKAKQDLYFRPGSFLLTQALQRRLISINTAKSASPHEQSASLNLAEIPPKRVHPDRLYLFWS